jgi:hypothetical protein
MSQTLAGRLHAQLMEFEAFRWVYGRLRNRHPQTFTEKLTYKMLRDRRELICMFADKVDSRDYVASIVGPEILSEALAVGERAADIDWDALPDEFVVKSAHGCGGTVVVSSQADPANRLPDPAQELPWEIWQVRPEHADRATLAAMFDQWLARQYRPQNEWVYGHVKPRIFIEELLLDADRQLPADYRFFVFDGRCAWIQVESGFIAKGNRRDFVTRDWEHLPFTSVYPRSESAPPRPPEMDRMIEIAEALGRDVDFVRVDLYDVDGRIVYGELTNYPAGGSIVFDPRSFDAQLGAFWTVPKRYQSPLATLRAIFGRPAPRAS